MSETEVADQVAKRPTERSPSFPYIGITKALERVEQLHVVARRHEVRIADAAKPAWGMGPKSSSTQQTVGALISYGLIDASGSGEARKIKISDIAFRAIADTRPGAKEEALKEIALKPRVVSEFRDRWGNQRPVDAIASADLMIDRGFTQEGARQFLRVYDDCISYLQESNSSIDDNASSIEDTQEKEEQNLPLNNTSVILEGVANDIDQFTVDDGVVKIIYPKYMSPDSVEELESFLQIFIKRAKRRALSPVLQS